MNDRLWTPQDLTEPQVASRTKQWFSSVCKQAKTRTYTDCPVLPLRATTLPTLTMQPDRHLNMCRSTARDVCIGPSRLTPTCSVTSLSRTRASSPSLATPAALTSTRDVSRGSPASSSAKTLATSDEKVRVVCVRECVCACVCVCVCVCVCMSE
jgi:hypothetical protein